MLQRRRQGRSTITIRLEQLERRDAPAVLSPATFFNDGTFFNDATRRLEGGMWQFDAATPTEANQVRGFVARYQSDLQSVKDTIAVERASGDLHNVTSTTAGHLNTIVTDLTNAIADAPLSIPGVTGAAGKQSAIHNLQLQIINIVNGDDFLADLAAPMATNAPGFMKVAPKLAVPLAQAPHGTFDEIGKIFNDSANRILGGLGSATNIAAINADINVMFNSLTELAADYATFAGQDVALNLARIHIQVIRDQLPGWQKFINDAQSHTDSIARQIAPKGSNDITLDLIDIAQGDPVLAASLETGWAVYPAFTTPPTPYQDNPNATDLATVNFFAHMDSDANNLGAEGVNAIVTGANLDPAHLADLTLRLNVFAGDVGVFDQAKGGLFEARFDNELISINSTTGAAIIAMIEALNTSNMALAQAAALQMHANVADVSGNNRWVSFDGPGGSIMWHMYNADGTTPDHNPVTGVLNQPGTPTLVI
jgi:hypothetical protein